ncbi:MAG: UDP-2,4-diacetamido-2,4,6-trideoxy-beta-L-altropyranose hydrolase [Gallionellaceae bacterium]
MKIAFRVDASLQMGSGHVMRCLTLADGLAAQGATCQFICRQIKGNLIATIGQRGFAVTQLPTPSASEEAGECNTNNSNIGSIYKGWLGISYEIDAAQTAAALSSKQPDWLVVDHYALDQQWENAMRPYARKLMVIDDLADRPHQCDLLLDQNLGRQPQDYSNVVPAQCKVLTGPQFALLRPEFAALRAYSLQRRQQPKLRQLLITMGGVDQHNATGQVLQALQDCALPQGCRIIVVMGLHAPWLQQVQAQAKDMHWPTEVLVNISDMALRMADSDLAIGAAGSTSWERCCLGLPTWMVVLADNQKDAAAHLEHAGAAYCMTLDTQLHLQLQDRTQRLLNQPDGLNLMSIHASQITDGVGVERVMATMQTPSRNNI